MLALAGAALPAASAVAACPNDAIRAQQGATALPDCRAYELVSPVDKNGAAIRQIVAARPDGDAVAFWSTGAFAGAPGNLAGNYSALRGADGWVTRTLNPPVLGRNPILMDQFYVDAMSDDFSQALIETRYPVDPDDAYLGVSINTGLPDIYRAEPDGSFRWLSPAATLPDRSGKEVVFGAATADLETVVYRTAKQVSADVPAGPDQQLYARRGDDVTLLSVAPGGDPLPGGAALGGNRGVFLETNSGSVVGGRIPSALSTDASTVWFSTYKHPFLPGPVPQLYVRSDALDPAAAATTQVSRSQAADSLGDDCATDAVFLTATQDGAAAWFTCASRLTDDAPVGGGIYRYDRASGQLQLIAPALDGSDVGGQLTLFGADRDADHVWFATASQLTADAPAGSAGLYLLHGDVVTFVAPLSWPGAITDAAVSPDGSRIAFATEDQLDADAGGVSQVYAADADDPGSVACISCRADGSTPLGRSDLTNAGAETFLDANEVPRRGNVTADGSIYFASADRLVAADENETADVYQYRDGQLALLSSGRDVRPSVFGAASDDGRDVFILTSERLTAQDTDNGSADVYAVRVDGGFAPTTPPPVCGEDCQGPLPPALAPPTPPTASFTGPGDEDDRSTAPATPKLTVTAPNARQRSRWAKTGRITLTARATHGGVLRARVSGRVRARTVTVAATSKRLARGGSARLTLRLSRAGRRQLARSGKLRVTIVVIHSQVADPRRVTLTLRAPAATQRNGGRR